MLIKFHLPFNLKDAAKEAETKVTGGQTVFNPWCIIGGIATSAVLPNEIIP